MIPTIDDILVDIIRDRLTFLKNNIHFIDEIFSSASDDLRNQLKHYLTTQNIKVIKNYPRDQAQLPAYAVLLGSEEEIVESLGNYLEDVGDGAELYGTMFKSRYRIETWSTNADLTVGLFLILKWIFLDARDALIKQGLLLQHLGAADLEPLPNFPDFPYRRALLFETTSEAWVTRTYETISEVVDESEFRIRGEH